MLRFASIAVSSLIACTCIAVAQPFVNQVTGTVAEGEVVTIMGTDFGPKTNAAPLLWDDFESGVAGEDLATGTPGERWPAYNEPGAYYNDGSIALNGSVFGAKSPPYSGNLFASNRVCGTDAPEYPGCLNDYFATNYHTFVPTDTLYYSYMFRWDVYDPNADLTAIIKFGRTNTNDPDATPYSGPGVLMFSGMFPEYPNTAAVIYYPAGASSSTVLGYPDNPARGQWRRQELCKINSTPGVSDGTITVDLVGETPIRQIDRQGDIMTRASGETWKQSTVILGLMDGDEGQNTEIDLMLSIDDVYVDNTRARVEIGNNADFWLCTSREIQIPQAWSSGQISVSVNAGHFASGSTAFLFVVDEAGRVSNGFPVEINGEAEVLDPPGPPLELGFSID